jgi:hypothetical protein
VILPPLVFPGRTLDLHKYLGCLLRRWWTLRTPRRLLRRVPRRVEQGRSYLNPPLLPQQCQVRGSDCFSLSWVGRSTRRRLGIILAQSQVTVFVVKAHFHARSLLHCLRQGTLTEGEGSVQLNSLYVY